MHWFEFAIAVVFGILFTAFRVFPGAWCEPISVRIVAGVFVVATGMVYLFLVDDERRPKASALHRMTVGSASALIVAAIANGSSALYALLGLIGAMAGYVGFRWLKHVPL